MNLPDTNRYQLNDNLMFDYHYQSPKDIDEWIYEYGVVVTGWAGDGGQVPGLFVEHPSHTAITAGSITPLII